MNRPAFVTSLACALIAAAVIWSAAVPPARGAEEQTLEIATKNGVRVFSVELAVTDEERQRGLMFRRSLPEFAACCSTSNAIRMCRCGCTIPTYRST